MTTKIGGQPVTNCCDWAYIPNSITLEFNLWSVNMNRTKHEKTIGPFLLCGVLLVLPFIVLWAGCTRPEYKQVKLEPGQVKQIKIGQTTQAEVEALLGKPTSSRKSNGQTQMWYANWKDDEKHNQVLEVVAPLAPGPAIAADMLFLNKRYTNENIIIVIGKDGYVEDVKGFAANGHLTGLLVKNDHDANLTKADQIAPAVTTREQVNALLGEPSINMSWSRASNNLNSQSAMWNLKTDQFQYLVVTFDNNGIVDEVRKDFKGSRLFPKQVNADKVAQIKERQSTRKTAESVLGSPKTISRNVQGSFYTYYIEVGKIKEEVYIEYDNGGAITRLIRKPLPDFGGF